ncbi:hypothetical protein TSOC_006045 [Tetrabaena socialis]|uniref:Uncharacterized protein n=1 Tax=Tetrabaena socialis TaxID=47790 RepID=A0A2J8A4Q1_9CHLO|nr:hypothetical protein TSOC_006045 [Tetrabaena socialis]|eukprot:PNH07499.1 hypothetical protein TSOC_006045 [Tetrabaena socialis]
MAPELFTPNDYKARLISLIVWMSTGLGSCCGSLSHANAHGSGPETQSSDIWCVHVLPWLNKQTMLMPCHAHLALVAKASPPAACSAASLFVFPMPKPVFGRRWQLSGSGRPCLFRITRYVLLPCAR